MREDGIDAFEISVSGWSMLGLCLAKDTSKGICTSESPSHLTLCIEETEYRIMIINIHSSLSSKIFFSSYVQKVGGSKTS